jgi:hypothetical protein
MRGPDPSSAPRQPRNLHGLWLCLHCAEWNDPENDNCFACDHADSRCPVEPRPPILED